VIQLILYPKKNKVHVNQIHDTEAANVKPHLFQHRWECEILLMLLLEGQAGKTLAL
jgi:hypothetical protein